MDEEGTRIESSIGQDLTWDTRDSRFNPSEGSIVRLSTTFSGVGGDVRNVKSTVGGGHYISIVDDLVLGLRGEFGHISGIFGDETEVSDRFFIGGNTFRGFEFGGVGPRDATTDDALGGKTYYVGTVEFTFPLGLPEEFDIRGRLFSDFGAVWDLDNSTTARVDDSSSPRITAGAGLSWNSPFGPVIIDLGFPVVKEDFDESQLLTFSFGTRF